MSYKAQCHVCFNVREFPDRTELWSSGKHTRSSHINDRSAGLTDQQRLGIQQSVRACPLQVASVVIDRSKKFSPAQRIAVSEKNVRAAARFICKERRIVLGGDLLDGIKINGTTGSMTQVSEALSLPRLIMRHNDPRDEFHLDAHQPVCCGYQFEDGVTYMTISTVHLLIKMHGCALQRQHSSSLQFCKGGIRCRYASATMRQTYVRYFFPNFLELGKNN